MKTNPRWRLKHVTDVPCPICGKMMYPTRKHTLSFRWLQCNNCGHWRLAIPDDEADRLQAEGVNKEKTRCYPVTHAWRREQWLRTKQSRFESVLDVGCGTGAFLLCFPEAKERVGISMDVATQSPSADIEHIHADFSHMKFDRQFGLVAAWHVVEHVADPLAFMWKLLAACAPGGIVGMEVPMHRHLSPPGAYEGHPQRFSAESWARAIKPLLELTQCLYLSAGFCERASLLLVRNTPPTTPMRWDDIQAGAIHGGRGQDQDYRDKNLGKYIRQWGPLELYIAAGAGLLPGYTRDTPSWSPDTRIEGINE